VRALPVALTLMDQARARKHGLVNLSGEMRAAGLMEPEKGSAGIVQASGVPGAR
jgi:hypothetical protein